MDLLLISGWLLPGGTQLSCNSVFKAVPHLSNCTRNEHAKTWLQWSRASHRVHSLLFASKFRLQLHQHKAPARQVSATRHTASLVCLPVPISVTDPTLASTSLEEEEMI